MAGLPTGVEIHNGKLRISFKYKNVRCREVLRGWIVNSSNIKKAGNLRALICAEIQLGTFKYEQRFPESKALKKFSQPTKSVLTFGELCDAYHAVKEVEISSATMMITRSVSALFTKIIGEHTAIEDIQLNDMLLYRKELLEGAFKARSEGQRTVRTVNAFMGQLCRMLSFAHQSNYIQHKPFENIKSLKTSELDPDPLLKEEFQELSKHWHGQHLNLWTFAVYTGLRHGELTGLAWEDVDLVSGEIHVKRTMTLTKKFGPPKTKAGLRTVKLLKPALEVLKRQFELTGHKEPTEIEFYHRERGKIEKQSLRFCFVPNYNEGTVSRHYSQSTINLTWPGAVQKSGIRYRSPYHTRHTYACWMLSAGANPSFIASQMGHKNARMVYTVYSKWIVRMNDDQIDMLNRKI